MTIDVDAARTFLLQHARILEIRLAELYLDGSSDATGVFAALEAYRNPDGGFGHGLEADVLSPDSQPLAADMAFAILDEVVAHRPELRRRAAEAAAEALPYLASAAAPDGGLRIVLPSVASYPRADHWGDGVFEPGLNPTAAIVGRARALGVGDPWADHAAEFCRAAIDAPDGVTDAHTALCVLRFLETEPDREWAEPRYQGLGDRLSQLAMFQLYPGEGYGLNPLHFAPSPDSPRRAIFPDDAVFAHLDALASGQQSDGGWAMTWEPPGPASVLAWRGVITLGALRTLTAYGKL